MSKLIELADITLTLAGRTILNIPEFSINKGEAISLMGPNGAGKSTLMLVMAALQEPSTGKRLFNGKDYNEYDRLDLHRKMAMVFQKPLMMDLTVMENAELGLRFRGVPRKVRRSLVKTWLERMGVAHLEKNRARFLSGGEAQRVILAQALVLEPDIIFLDEPFSNLDKDIREELMEEVSRLLAERKTTTVLVTHHKTEAYALSDTIVFMEDGKIIGFEDLSRMENRHKWRRKDW